MMLEGAGFEVVDLGINTPVEEYLSAIDEHEPNILVVDTIDEMQVDYVRGEIEKQNQIK